MAMTPELSAADVPRSVDSCESLRRYVQLRGGADIEASTVIITFRGTRIDPAIVTGVRAVIDSRSDPMTGTRFDCPSAGTSVNQETALLLDEAEPVLREEASDGTVGGPYFRNTSLTLGKDEVVTFTVTAEAFTQDYSWHLEASVRAGGKEVTLRVPGAFHTTASVGTYGEYWDWDWSQNPGRLAPGGTL